MKHHEGDGQREARPDGGAARPWGRPVEDGRISRPSSGEVERTGISRDANTSRQGIGHDLTARSRAGSVAAFMMFQSPTRMGTLKIVKGIAHIYLTET